MKNCMSILLLNLVVFSSVGQNMTITQLDLIFKEQSDSLVGQKSKWQFMIKEVPFIAIADSTHNRMRIISPIIESERLNDELKTASLMANFHTALDIKYAISEDILWSTFIHPLKELSKEQVINAIDRVYYGHVNFGTSFSSTPLIFPGSAGRKEKEPVETFENKI